MKVCPTLTVLFLSLAVAGPARSQISRGGGSGSPPPPSAIARNGVPIGNNVAPTSLATLAAEGGLTLDVTDIVISRSFLTSEQTRVGLALSGATLPPDALLRRVKVTAATDDTGRDLTAVEPVPPALVRPSPRLPSGRALPPGALRPNLMLYFPLGKVAPRATALRRIEGTAEVFAPSRHPDAALLVTNALEQAGKPLSSPVLSRHGLEVIVLTRDTWETARARLGEFGRTMPDFSGTVVYVRDPQARFAGLDVNDGASAMGSGSSTRKDDALLFQQSVPLSPRTQLTVFVAVPEALTEIPFKFETITLP